VLVLCHGNINRSPLAGAVLEAMMGGPEYVRSRALKPNAQGPATKKVREFASLRGFDLSQHRAQTVSVDDMMWADLVVYMDGGNLKRIQNQFPAVLDKSYCLAHAIGQARIPDPAFMKRGSSKLNQVLADIMECAQNLACQLGLNVIQGTLPKPSWSR
jgi:protein-tyrosine phosphatase